jgi:gas vesicle protein
MEDDNKFSYFFLGLGLGVAAGLLFAPKTGAETRDLLLSKADEGKDYLKRRTDESKDYLKRRSSELRDQAEDVIEKGKSAVTKQRDNLSAAVEAGKQAYRDAVSGASSDTGDAPEGI